MPSKIQWISSNAVFSNDGRYRYELWRRWKEGLKGWVALCMLNPSTADETTDDPTIRRCIGFSRRWGFRGLIVVNLFAFRATKPASLKEAEDPVGPENDLYIAKAAETAEFFVCAWGVHGNHQGRGAEVLSWLRANADIRCLGTTDLGFPRHPLFLRKDKHPVMFETT